MINDQNTHDLPDARSLVNTKFMSQKGTEPPVLHVLVVEDDLEQQDLLVGALTRMGCRVDAAKDGEEAYRLLRDRRPRMVLMDLNIPKMNGWEVIKNVRDRARMNGDGEAPYIVAYSALGSADARRAAFDAGCDEYVVKPLDISGAIRAYALRHGFTLQEERKKTN